MSQFKNNLKQIQLGGSNLSDGVASYPNNLASTLKPHQFFVNNHEDDPAIFTIGHKGNIVRISGGAGLDIETLRDNFISKDRDDSTNYAVSFGDVMVNDMSLGEFFSLLDYTRGTDGSIVNLGFKSNLWAQGGITALGKDSSGGGGTGGVTSLGNLVNVGSWADETPTVDRIFCQTAGSSHWSSKPLSEVVGLDKVALGEYLTTNGYATQDWVNGKGFLTSVSWDKITGKPDTFYTLPTASASVLGGVKIGSGLVIESGVVRVNLSESHIPTLGISKVSGLQTALDNKLNASTFDELFTPIYENGVLKSIRANFNFWSVGGITALGNSGSSEGGTGGLIQTVYGYGDLGGTFSNTDLTSTFNPYTTNQLYLRIKSLEENGALTFNQSGPGNVVTSVVKSGNVVTVTKGLTAATTADLQSAIAGIDLSGFVTLNTAQTISGVKTFSAAPILNNYIAIYGKNTSGVNQSLLWIDLNNYSNFGNANNRAYINSSNLDIVHNKAGIAYTMWDASNSNLSTIDWNAKNLTVAGTSTLTGAVTTGSTLTTTGNIYSKAGLFTHGKTSTYDGIAGLAVGSGNLYLTSPGAPAIYFSYANATGATSYIYGDAGSIAFSTTVRPTNNNLYSIGTSAFSWLHGYISNLFGITATLTGSATIGGNLGVTGAVTSTGGFIGNATTASALYTTRYLWGQTFNGSANVSGAMSGVTSITMSGALSGATTGSFSSTLSVTGVATMYSDLVVNGNIVSGTTITATPISSFRSTIFGNTYAGARLKTVRANVTLANFSDYYSCGIAAASSDTHMWLSVGYNAKNVYVGGGSGDVLNWTGTLFHNQTHCIPYATNTYALGSASYYFSNIYSVLGTFSSNVMVGGVLSSSTRIFTGYDSGVANSISCSNYFRSNGATGWYNATYGAGIISDESGVVRTYSTNRLKVYSTAGAASTTGASIATVGGLYVGENILSYGGITALGSATSDMRLKTDINKFDAMTIINKLPVFAFKWNEKGLAWNKRFNNDNPHYGTSAQEVKKVLPDFVSEIDGHLVVSYEKFTPILMGALKIHDMSIKSLADRAEKHESEIDMLKRENKELKQRIKILEETSHVQ